MTTKKLPRKVDLNAPVDWVFVFLTAPGQLVEVMPSLAEVANAEEKPDGGHSFDSVYKMASLCLHGHSATSMVEPNKRVIVKTTGGIPSTFDDGYEVVGKGMRRTLTIDDTSPGAVLGKLAEPIVHRVNEHEAEVKTRVKVKAKARTRRSRSATRRVRRRTGTSRPRARPTRCRPTRGTRAVVTASPRPGRDAPTTPTTAVAER
ncbi:MAG: hypothetical protein FJ137_09560 [Deltaproteobacteria bacterium]|nr:hypothetical protein [Deltaproteobacteria bacterium]